MEISSGFVSIATPDLPRLQAFYQGLFQCLPLAERLDIYTEFRLPGLRLVLYRSQQREFSGNSGSISLCLQVNNLDAFLQNHPHRQEYLFSSLREADYGREVDFPDHDGNRIILYEPSQAFNTVNEG